MRADAPATRLPTELRTAVFDSLVLTDLLAASWVCRAWRTTAHAHQTFWKDVKLSSSSSAAADCFLARVAASKPAAAISLTVMLDVSATLEPQRARSIIDAISSNIHRVEDLHLTPFVFDRALIPVVWDALRRPAPLMISFTFTGVSGPCLLPLPRDLFAGKAPKLRSMLLRGVVLNDTAPFVFSQIQVVEHTFLSCSALSVTGVPRSRGHLLFSQFPAAQLLKFELCNIDAAALPSTPAFDMSRLQICAPGILDAGGDFRSFCRWGALARFGTIQVGGIFQPDSEASNVLLEHLLPDELYLGVSVPQDRASLLFIVSTRHIIASPQTAPKRIFVSRADAASLAPITSGRVLSAVTTVKVPWRALALAAAWLGGALPVLRHLLIELEHDVIESPLAEGYCVATPALQLVMLQARAPTRVASGVLEHLVTKVLVMSARALKVALEHVVVVDGDLTRLNDVLFGTIDIAGAS